MAQESGVMKEKDEKVESALATSPRTAIEVTEESQRTASATGVSREINGDNDPEEIRAKIDETRSEMGETLDEIQERLSVANISEQVSEQVNSAIETVKTTAYDATIGKAVNFMRGAENELRRTTVGRTVMNNPIPFALIGAGAAMLLMRMKDQEATRSRHLGSSTGLRRLSDTSLRGETSGRGDYGGEGITDKAKHTYENAAKTAKDKYDSAYDSVSGAASSAYDSVAGAADSTYSGAVGLVSKARDRAGDLTHTVQDNYDYYAEEKPLALAAAAVAVGAAIGFAIPSSRYESEMMGETRDNLMERAEQTAGDLVDQVKETASNAGRAASEELGLSGESGSQSKSASGIGGQTSGQTGGQASGQAGSQKGGQQTSAQSPKNQSNR